MDSRSGRFHAYLELYEVLERMRRLRGVVSFQLSCELCDLTKPFAWILKGAAHTTEEQAENLKVVWSIETGLGGEK